MLTKALEEEMGCALDSLPPLDSMSERESEEEEDSGEFSRLNASVSGSVLKSRGGGGADSSVGNMSLASSNVSMSTSFY